MPSIELTWHTQMDDRVCPICKALNNYVWKFVAGKDNFPNVLQVNGQNVWDVHQGSRAHGHEGFNCRCHISSEIFLSDLRERFEAKRDELKANVEAMP